MVRSTLQPGRLPSAATFSVSSDQLLALFAPIQSTEWRHDRLSFSVSSDQLLALFAPHTVD